MQPEQTPPPVPQPLQPTPSIGDPLPGKVLGIVGFIMAFLGLEIPGLILSIISLSQAKKADRKNSLALAGIILNGVFFFASIILFFVLVTVVSYNGVTGKANTQVQKSAATTVAKYAESYNADNDTYPTTYSQISSQVPSGITQATSPIVSAPSTPSADTIAFYTCNDATGNKIGYWSYDDSDVEFVYVGGTTPESTCTFVGQ